MLECFIVDWPVAKDRDLLAGLVVAVNLRGRPAGLYRVKEVLQEGMLLAQGAISFPVGTHLDVEFLNGNRPGIRYSGRVEVNDHQGLSVAWISAA